MFGPNVSVDLQKIERNARTVVAACRKHAIGVFGVTKGTCGMPQVARAMLRGGVIGIGESRFENIRRLRASGIGCPILLLRSPPLSRVEEVIRSVDLSLNSELAIIEELSRVAERMGRVHDIILMVDLGDLREGIWPDELVPTVAAVLELPGVRITGIGTNLTCFGAVLPSEQNMNELVDHARELERRFGLDLRFVSGGNSSTLPLVLSGKIPAGINNLRIGEAILQGGRDTFFDEPTPSGLDTLERDAFVLTGELLEVKTKPSVPLGETGRDAFGRRPVFEDKGERLRGIVNVGREDVIVEGLTPVREGVKVLGASSDHLVVDLTDVTPTPAVGDTLGFHMSYGALLAAMTSEYVEKTPLLEPSTRHDAARVNVLVESDLEPVLAETDLESRFGDMGLGMRVFPLVREPAGPDPDRHVWPQADIDNLVSRSLAAHVTPLLIGSDHSLSLAGFRALSRCVDAFGVIWLDSTPSFMPPAPEQRATGDTVLYRALGYDPRYPALQPQLSPENIVLIGLRDVQAMEAEIIRDSRVTVFTMTDVDALGIREVMRQALHVATPGTRGLYVSYSPRVTDLPGVEGGSGGITVRETHQAMEIIAATEDMLIMDVVGIGAEAGSRLAAETSHFILSCFGKQII
ncbi:MAG: alanine racemase [Gammaproteobacteria bacterium]|nr:alanine racemase [Gammaproteobacteria bacterium]